MGGPGATAGPGLLVDQPAAADAMDVRRTLGLGTDGEQGHVVAAEVGGEALDGLAHGRHEPRSARAGRGGSRLEQPVLIELLRATPALGDAVGVEQQCLPGGQQVLGAVQLDGLDQAQWVPNRPISSAVPSARTTTGWACPASTSSTVTADRPSCSVRLSIAAASVQNCCGSPASTMTSLSISIARTSGRPSRTSARSTSRTRPVRAAARAPLPHTSPMVTSHRSGPTATTS